MTITIKTPEEITKMRIAGRLAADVLEMIEPHVKPGVSTDELNTLCHDYIVNVQQAIPAPLNYGRPPFPKSICTSINHQICHGIPSDKRLKKGDEINIDITVLKDGYHGDTSKMFSVGEPTIAGKRLAQVTQRCLYLGILQVKPGAKLSAIGKVIQAYAHSQNYSVVQEFCGHGIGAKFHEDPQVLHYYHADNDKIIMEPGMIFTIEPMINQGKRDIKLLPDQWTVVTKDHKLSAQWEHTVLVTDTGFEILTLRPEEEGWQERMVQ
ncbi:type I methionyl aminopeptidase [Thiofilum flexile]|uniref:type I methionyl aminopeptidase n=1 Tax=Thiofilum flexile TaxID=125627 RepID=UPI000369692D|nr:type I methionyl aminopeptidase [Thiofilum flexile]